MVTLIRIINGDMNIIRSAENLSNSQHFKLTGKFADKPGNLCMAKHEVF